MSNSASGYLRSGLPFNRLGHGPRPLVVFQGLLFENKPRGGWLISMYNGLGDDYTVWVVLRKPGLPHGYTMSDMANDYAQMIVQEFAGPVDVIGVSTGGSICQVFAAEHPDLVRRLVIHSSAYTLSPESRRAQMEVARHASQGNWSGAWAAFLRPMAAHWPASRAAVWFFSRLIGINHPRDASDLVVTIEAEDVFNFKDRLTEIEAPTLVVAGAADPFYSEQLFRDTAAGIPSARLILYPGMGHPAMGKQFTRDVLAFLREGP